jgi:hypothetical protein
LADRHHFDRLVLEAIADIEDRWSGRLGLIEYAVEDAPRIPDDWSDVSVPLSSLVRGSASTPTRLVIFRRPVELRAADRVDLAALVHAVVVEQVADLLGLRPSEVDPRYTEDQ